MHTLLETVLPPTLTREQVAQLWGVSRNTVSSYVKRGAIPKPIPGSRKWSKAEVIRARDNPAREAAAQAHAAEDGNVTPFEKWRRARGR